MYPALFEYHSPATLAEVLQLLEGDNVRPLAGGQSLLPLMKLRFAEPATLVDLSQLTELRGVERRGEVIVIGAMTTHAEVAGSALLREGTACLSDAAAVIGDPQIRNRGTIGGSLAHADPGADYPSAAVAVGAVVVVAGSNGERRIAAGDFFTGLFQSALGPGEVIVRVEVPVEGNGVASAYVKFKHPASGYAVVGVAAKIVVAGGVCASVSAVAAGVVSAPLRLVGVEEALGGREPTPAAIAAAVERFAESVESARSDSYASSEYRLQLGRSVARDALAAAAWRAQGERS